MDTRQVSEVLAARFVYGLFTYEEPGGGGVGLELLSNIVTQREMCAESGGALELDFLLPRESRSV